MAVEGIRLTRKGFIALSGAACAALAGAPVRGYVSRPDLKPPAIGVSVPADGTAAGSIFLAPFDIAAASGAYQSTPNSQSHSGPLVVDDPGEPIWFLPLGSTTAMDVRGQTY